MKALIQRVSEARVEVDEKTVGEIGNGLLLFLCVEKGDTDKDIEYIARKVSCLRIFKDSDGKMNLSVKDIGGEVLVISQFTLAANCRKGNRPSFEASEEPSRAKDTYMKVAERLKQEGITTAKGEFAAHMKVHLINDGPVTIPLDSTK